MRIEVTMPAIKYLYLLILGLDLFFIVVNSPLFTPLAEAGFRSDSILDFVRYQLDLKREGVLATWYSSALLLITGLAAFWNAWFVTEPRKAHRLYRSAWFAVGLLFIALSADEVAQVHEEAARIYNVAVIGTDRARVPVGAGDWIPLLLPLIVIGALGLIVFASVVLRRYWKSLTAALVGVVCWVGVLFAESIEAGWQGIVVARNVEGFIEESLEIIGATCFLFAFIEFSRQKQRERGLASQELDDNAGSREESMKAGAG